MMIGCVNERSLIINGAGIRIDRTLQRKCKQGEGYQYKGNNFK